MTVGFELLSDQKKAEWWYRRLAELSDELKWNPDQRSAYSTYLTLTPRTGASRDKDETKQMLLRVMEHVIVRDDEGRETGVLRFSAFGH